MVTSSIIHPIWKSQGRRYYDNWLDRQVDLCNNQAMKKKHAGGKRSGAGRKCKRMILRHGEYVLLSHDQTGKSYRVEVIGRRSVNLCDLWKRDLKLELDPDATPENVHLKNEARKT